MKSNKNTSIMNVSFEYLQNMLKEFLCQLDDYQQLAGDNNNSEFLEDLNRDYAVIENWYNFSSKRDLNHSERNYIRLTMKDSYKTAMQYSN